MCLCVRVCVCLCLGASALDKRERKKWQASMVTRIGGRPDKAPRTPAAIGKGVAVKSGVREARQLEEAMQAGMVKRKGYNKKKRLEAGKGKLGRSMCSLHVVTALSTQRTHHTHTTPEPQHSPRQCQ